MIFIRLFIISLLFVAPLFLKAQPLTKLLGPVRTGWSFFGESVAAHGDYLFVGQPARDAFSNVKEYGYVYKHNSGSWNLIQTIQGTPNALGRSDYGERSGMSGRWLAVNRHLDDDYRVYLYELTDDTFAFRQIIHHSVPFNGNFQCKTIALSDEHLILGGRAEIKFYRPVNGVWEFQQIISKSTEGFGAAIAIDGNTAVVGSQVDSEFGILDGATHVFEFDGFEWRETHKIGPSDPEINHAFGGNVALFEDILIVGDFVGVHNSKDDFSAAYIFKKDVDGIWREIQKLVSPSGDSWSKFGSSFAFTDKYLYIGADEDNRVYKYEKTDSIYRYIRAYEGEYGAGFYRFGSSMAITGNTVFVGSPGYDNLRGAVYGIRATEEFIPAVGCGFPFSTGRDTFFSDQLNYIFQSDNPLLPEEFGVIEIDKFFQGEPTVKLCFNDSTQSQKIDFVGFEIANNPGLEVTWSGSFEKDGDIFTAEDVLDNKRLLQPTLLQPIKSPMWFDVSFGLPDDPPCETFSVEVVFADFQCSEDTTVIYVVPGEQIRLEPNCNFSSPSSDYFYVWTGSGYFFDDPNQFIQNVTVTDTTLFKFETYARIDDLDCSGFNYFQVIPDAGSVEVNDFIKSAGLKITPNPTKDFISVEYRNLHGEAAINSLSGKTVLKSYLKTGFNKIDIGELPPGIYFLKTRSGQASKFVKI